MAESIEAHDWKSDYWIWVPLTLVGWHLAWKYQDGFISDWDTFDYTSEVINGVPTALGLGRALFLGYNRAVWLAAHRFFQLQPENAYLVLRYGVIALTGPAVAGVYALFKELSASRLAAAAGALLFVNSPFFIVYSGRGMSEIPGFALFSWGAWWMFRKLRLGNMRGYVIGAILFGLSANMREFAVFYFPVIPLAGMFRTRFRWVVIASIAALIAVFAGPIFWSLYLPEYYLPSLKAWYSLSANERMLHPVDVARNWGLILKFGYQCSAAAMITAPFALAWLLVSQWRDIELRPIRWPMVWMAIFSWLGTLAMLENHDLEVNPRYMLIMMPGVALSCGWLLSDVVRRNHLLTAVCIVYLGYFGLREQWPEVADTMEYQHRASWEAKGYLERLRGLDGKAVFVVGSRTPLVNFYQSIGARPNWQTVAAGSGWPDQKLGEVINQLMSAGYTVYVDFDPDLWATGEREVSRERPGLDMIRREYLLEPISGELFQVIRQKTH